MNVKLKGHAVAGDGWVAGFVDDDEPQERIEFRFDSHGRLAGATLVMPDDTRILLKPDKRTLAERIRDSEMEMKQIQRAIERLTDRIASTPIAVEPCSWPRAPRAGIRPREHRSGRSSRRRGPPKNDPDDPSPPPASRGWRPDDAVLSDVRRVWKEANDRFELGSEYAELGRLALEKARFLGDIGWPS